MLKRREKEELALAARELARTFVEAAAAETLALTNKAAFAKMRELLKSHPDIPAPMRKYAERDAWEARTRFKGMLAVRNVRNDNATS